MWSLIFLKSDPYYGDNAQTALKCRDLVTKKNHIYIYKDKKLYTEYKILEGSNKPSESKCHSA